MKDQTQSKVAVVVYRGGSDTIQREINTAGRNCQPVVASQTSVIDCTRESDCSGKSWVRQFRKRIQRRLQISTVKRYCGSRNVCCEGWIVYIRFLRYLVSNGDCKRRIVIDCCVYFHKRVKKIWTRANEGRDCHRKMLVPPWVLITTPQKRGTNYYPQGYLLIPPA